MTLYLDKTIIKYQLPFEKKYTLFFSEREFAKALRRRLDDDEYVSDDFLIQEAYMHGEWEHVDPNKVLTLVDQDNVTATLVNQDNGTATFEDEYARRYYIDYEVVTEYYWHTATNRKQQKI